MPTYNVELDRKMRFYFPGIKAETPEEAAKIAANKATDEATMIVDYEGESVIAEVDPIEGDGQRVTIDLGYVPIPPDLVITAPTPEEGRKLLNAIAHNASVMLEKDADTATPNDLLAKATALLEARKAFSPGEVFTYSEPEVNYPPALHIRNSTWHEPFAYPESREARDFIALAANTACDTIRGYLELLGRMVGVMEGAEAHYEWLAWHACKDDLDRGRRAGVLECWMMLKPLTEEARTALPQHHTSTAS